MSFTNVYYKRTAGTPRPCYVCDRPTTTVLATINTVDFIYSCPGHLTDHNFATRIVDAEGTPAKSSVYPSPEMIAQIKEEWEEKQKRKKEKEKEREKEKEGQEKEKGKQKGEDVDATPQGKAKEGSKSPPPPSGTSSPLKAPVVHERYALHRDFYSMRQLEHKKRRQAAQAKELAPRLPGAPTASVVPSQEQKY